MRNALELGQQSTGYQVGSELAAWCGESFLEQVSNLADWLVE